MMSEAELVSPATCRKPFSRFILLIRRRRVQTDSKEFPYLLFHNISGESGFDRAYEGVKRVLYMLFEFDPALAASQSDKCTVKYETIS